jgi:hypothetical protein
MGEGRIEEIIQLSIYFISLRGNPWGFESPPRHYRNTQSESGLTPGSLFRGIGPSGSRDGHGIWDHLNLIFPVYLKLMTGSPTFQPENVGVGLLH